jgi:hypothetical protein
MNAGEVEFRITADSREAEKSINETEEKVGSLGDAVKAAAQSAQEFAEGFREGFEEAAKGSEEASKSVEQTAEKTKEASKATDDFTRRLKERITDTIYDAVMKSISQVIDSTKALITETAAAGDTIDKQSQRLGMTNEKYQEWSYILSQNGADISTLTMGMKTLTNQIDALGSGSKSAAEAFAKLGLSYEQLEGLSGEQQLTAVVQKLQGMKDETQRNAVANDLLGRSYMDLIPLLNQSAESVEELRARAHETGQIISDEAVQAAVDYTDAMDTLSKSFDGFKERIGAEILPGITEVAEGITDLINGIDGGEEKIQEGIDKAITAGEKVIPRIGTLIGTAASAAGKMAPDVIRAILNGIIDALPTIADGFVGLAKVVTDAVKDVLPDIGTAGGAVVSTIMTAILDELSKPEEIAEVLEAFELFGENLCEGVGIGIMRYDWGKVVASFENGLAGVLESGQKHVQVWLDNLWTGGSVYGGDINNVQTSPFIENMRKGTEEVLSYYEKGKAELDEVFDAYESSKRKDALTEKEETVAEDVSAGAGALGEAAELAEEKTETLGEAMARLDRLYAKHRRTEEGYWAERLEILNKYRDEESVVWWQYYDETEEYYRKQAEAEANAQKAAMQAEANAQKAAMQALREKTENAFRDMESEKYKKGYSDEWLLEQKRKYIEEQLDHNTELYKDYDNKLLKLESDAAEKRRKAEEDAQKKAEEERKKTVERVFRDFETDAAKRGLGDDALLQKKREYIETELDHDTELYKDYDNKLAKQERSMTEKAEKEAQKKTDAYKKAFEEIEKAQKKLADQISFDTDDLFRTETKTDKRTGATDTDTKVALDNFRKQIEAKKKLPEKIAKLLDSGVPDTLIKDILKLDPTDAVKICNELAASPAKLNEIVSGLKADESISAKIAEMMTENTDEFKALGADAGKMFEEGFFEGLGSKFRKFFDSGMDTEAYAGFSAINAFAANYVMPSGSSTQPQTAAQANDVRAKPAISAGIATTLRLVDANGTYLAKLVNAENSSAAVRGGK